MKIHVVKTMLQQIKARFKKYQIVAYNNRMYTGYRPVNNYLYTWIGSKLWLNEFADRTRYVYDLYDTKKKRLVHDYSDMFTDFEWVKKQIKNSHFAHEDAIRRLIFNYKYKWTTIAGDQAASIYFADLMVIFNEHYHPYQIAQS
jgi:hypothetical protein